MFHAVTPEELGRADVFRHFTEEAPCSFSFCTDLDITALRRRSREAGVGFFPAFLHCLSAEVNAHREFCMGMQGDVLGYYDQVDPCYTVFHAEDERFSDVWTQYCESFSEFYARYRADAEEYGGPKMKPAKPYAGANLFNVSCIPWASFTGFALNLPKSEKFFSPVFTIGKYFAREGKLWLPVAVQVHHAVCDGYHVCLLLNGLAERMQAARFSG